MNADALAALKRLSDGELVERVKTLAAREREATAQLVAHLAEMETRDIHLRAGFGSLFAYCRDALCLSEHEAYNRIEAARAARRFPLVLQLLTEGALNLTTVRLLAPHLTQENHRTVLESARGKKKAEVEEIVVRLLPHPDILPSIRRLPTPQLGPRAPLASPVPTGSGRPGVPFFRPAAPSATPLSPDRYRVQLTIGGDTLEKLRLAKDMLRHAIPSGDDAALFDRALTALLVDLAKKKFAATADPRPSPGSDPQSRHIPAEVRRAVWLRDLGRCAFVGTAGHRCSERAFLEFHHLRPYAVGGAATADNITLRCRRHNDFEARTYFEAGREGGAGTPELVPERAGEALTTGAYCLRRSLISPTNSPNR